MSSIRELLTWGDMTLRMALISTPALDAGLLMSHASDMSKEQLVVSPDQEVSEEVAACYKGLIHRRCLGEPIAYIIRKKEFFASNFYVDQRVLIPRPDSEVMVSVVAEHATKMPSAHVVDLGCGSGALGLSIKKACPSVTLSLVDDASVFPVVTKNITELGVDSFSDIHMYEMSAHAFFASGVIRQDSQESLLLVANLPYVPVDYELPVGVARFEPAHALFAGVDGLDFYRDVLRQLGELYSEPITVLANCITEQRESVLHHAPIPQTRIVCVIELFSWQYEILRSEFSHSLFAFFSLSSADSIA